ncbi:hypothetical protein H0B56_00145 [Haloechinothrix sp. YIM 98757]|uniref:DUF6973 domain-containing protein n=1 Tax=Haloechinothrix aidingensis TaxID=2752311 RepID=A0A838A351_9PSEU|nr:hypothetical protein [Haloechinothrix aidingensis]MBA0123950.1 hypothetical protein [Haloechinothrix aidingensis]
MVSWADVKKWDPTAVGRVADRLKRHRDALVGLEQEAEDAAPPGDWVGQASRAARNELSEHVTRLEEIVAELSAAFTGTADAEAALEDTKRAIGDAEGLAERHEFGISDTGEVVSLRESSASDSFAVLEHRSMIQADLVEQVSRILSSATELDNSLADTLHRAAADGIEAEGGSLSEIAESGAEQAGPGPHEELLEQYNVAPDPDGMTMFPPEWMDWIPGVSSMEMTATEAEILDNLMVHEGAYGVYEAYEIYQEALHQGEQVFDGEGITDGHSDAFRHAYWNAQLTQRFGEEWTAEYTIAHEGVPDGHPTPVAMDLHNNEVGRRIAVENPDASQEELRELLEQAVRDGEMVVIDSNDRLQYSDQVEMGNTRPTNPDNDWPTDNPQRDEHTRPPEPEAYPEHRY